MCREQLNPLPQLPNVKQARTCFAEVYVSLQLQPFSSALLFPSTTVYVFSDHFPQICLHLSSLSLTDKKSSISSSPAINFSLSSAELAIPPSPVLPSNSIDFCIHRSLVTTRLDANSCGNPMDTMSQFEVWPSIITIHATFGMSDITGAQENLFGVVGKTRRLWNISIPGQN